MSDHRAPLNRLSEEQCFLAYRMRLTLIAAKWNSQIRELIVIHNTLGDLRRIEVGDQRGSSVGFEARIDQGNGSARYGPYLDRYDVVEDSASVRESRQVASQYSENIWLFGWRNSHVQPQQIRRRFASEILEAWYDARGDAGEQDGLQVHARFAIGSQVREHSWIQDWKQACQFGMRVVLDKLTIIDRVLRVPIVLLAHRDDHFINQGFAQARDLHQWPGLIELPIALNDRSLLSAGGGPDTNHLAGVTGTGGI